MARSIPSSRSKLAVTIRYRPGDVVDRRVKRQVVLPDRPQRRLSQRRFRSGEVGTGQFFDAVARSPASCPEFPLRGRRTRAERKGDSTVLFLDTREHDLSSGRSFPGGGGIGDGGCSGTPPCEPLNEKRHSRNRRIAVSVIWETCWSTGRLLTQEIDPTENTPPPLGVVK